MMEKVDTLVTDSVWESIHSQVQEFVQNRLSAMQKTSFRKKKDLTRYDATNAMFITTFTEDTYSAPRFYKMIQFRQHSIVYSELVPGCVVTMCVRNYETKFQSGKEMGKHETLMYTNKYSSFKRTKKYIEVCGWHICTYVREQNDNVSPNETMFAF